MPFFTYLSKKIAIPNAVRVRSLAFSEENAASGGGWLACGGDDGLLKVLRPEKGQALLVTAASGAVGQLVGQIARHVCECSVVVGTAGGSASGGWR